jgi:hypothetical protein
LVGFVPQYVKARRLETELQQARRENDGAKLRDLAGLAYFQANQKNYGLAAATATLLFSRARELSKQTQAANYRKSLEDVVSLRDKLQPNWRREIRQSCRIFRKYSRRPGRPLWERRNIHITVACVINAVRAPSGVRSG